MAGTDRTGFSCFDLNPTRTPSPVPLWSLFLKPEERDYAGSER